MEHGDCYNFDHEPIGLLELVDVLSDTQRCLVGSDAVGTVTISTTFLGVNQGTLSAPVLYETYIEDITGNEVWAGYYPTREGALAGHDRAVAWAKAPHLASAPSH